MAYRHPDTEIREALEFAELERRSLRGQEPMTDEIEAPPHNFTFVLGPQDELTEDLIERVLEVCDDALVGGRDQQAIVEFDREAPRFADAVISALKELEQIPGIRVIRVEPDELVSLSAIAARLGRSVESIRLLAAGERGPGRFPAPIARVDAKTRLWEWSAIARWWHDNMDADEAAPLIASAGFLASLNDALDLRVRAQELDDNEKRVLLGIVRDAALP